MADEVAEAVARWLSMLDLERSGDDVFTAQVPESVPGTRLFGGQVAAQALRAATLTVDGDRHPHSLHGYFLRPGRPGTPLELEVDRIRNGSSFSTRRVVASQRGEAIFNLSASFHRDEPDEEYQIPLPDGVPDPEADHQWDEGPFRAMEMMSPFDIRDVGPSRVADGAIETTRRLWIKVRAAVPDERALQACLLTFLSDMGAVHAAALPVGLGFGTPMMGASLDHAVWFHRPVRVDDWLLFDLKPISNAGSRGLVIGSFHDRSGRLGATVAQEALVRRLAR